MADPDIPIAYGTPIAPPITPSAPPDRNLQSATQINGGRSSRILLPRQEFTELDERQIQMLMDQGYTRGLAESLRRNKLALPLSIWIVDNSGSMNHRDGHRIVETSKQNQVKFVNCTRWAEMQQTVEYHAQMAALLQSPTVFRMLNDPGRTVGPQQFSIAERGAKFIDEDLATAQQTMSNACPGGVTPLVPHLREIRDNVLALEPKLRNDGTKVVLVLATDGLPTNNRGISNQAVKEEFVDSLRALEGLPIWIVVRLCTDEDEVVDFWNSLDEQLELSLEVLDDFTSEAQEVHEHNPWLNYGLPLHRMREMGFHHRLFDMLDERKLIRDGELRDFFRLLFGDGSMDGVPEPEADWKGFYAKITKITHEVGKTWNPMTKRMDYWVDLKRLKKDYGDSGWFW
uniref:VWFA domain-containing protein n=1 Tax=Entomoneis paludosa TaxID=265537 RepID=A0A7S3DN03_9STRA|mmetsp:Transcript_22239/g.46379  ORF Transcript_22239/g.46379 Transcript_22239/m.46379 type:complete len:400 (+) Transcript_22239:82-1281(+)